jgi:hypothetical protein
MLYLYADKNQVKLLFQKKTILGQYESAFYEKSHQMDITENGQISNMDFFASAIREALTVVSPAALKEKGVNLILPREAFSFMRAEVPADIANSAIAAFIRDKARAHLTMDLDNCLFDYYIQENDTGKVILFYAITKEIVKKYQEALSLLNLQIENIIPESLAYFKLFEKTLRKDKKEYIMYASYEKGEVKAYVYDSYGPLEDPKIHHKITSTTTLEHLLKKVADEYETNGKKLNRLILSGQDSETIRQDTFTKDVGIWTNPLKRIIPQFYEDYLKILVTTANQAQQSSTAGASLPFLVYDVCIGAFIFSLENKQFSFFKKGGIKISEKSNSGPKKPMRFPVKEIALFIGSFALSFIVLMAITKLNGAKILSPQAKNQTNSTATATPEAPTPTPTVDIDRKTVKVKILNGSGTKGQATTIKDMLKEKGYTDIVTGNADNFDYTTTEIQVSKDKKGLDSLVKGDIKDSVSDPKVTELKDDTSADVVIIFGADWK